MSTWLISALAAAFASALAGMLAPEGKTKQYVTFAISALLLLTLLAPLPGMRGLGESLGELFQEITEAGGEQTDDGAALETVMQAAEQALLDTVRRELGLSEDALDLALEYAVGGDRPILCGVTVYVGDVATGERVRALLERELGVKCEVIVS